MASTTINTLRRKLNAEQELTCTRPGYYLVKGDARYFISATVNEAALNRVADRVLSESKGWDYWIDYSSGPSVTGAPAWANMDQTDRFI